MKIEERGLPPSLSYLNRRLTGQPLFTAIWLVYVLTVTAAVYALDSGRGTRGTFIMCCILVFDFIVVFAVLSVAVREGGRKWLLSKYDDGDCAPVSKASQAFVRILPFLGLVVVAEYLYLR